MILRVAIHVLAVTDFDHMDYQDGILNRVENSIMPLPDSIKFPA